MSIFTELKELEKEIEKTDYEDGQISFNIWCELVPMDMSDLNSLKDILVKNKVIAAEDNVTLTKIDEPAADMEPICQEWHFGAEITSRLINIAENSDGYYSVWADGSYAEYGHLWSTCRILQKGNESVVIEFYICD